MSLEQGGGTRLTAYMRTKHILKLVGFEPDEKESQHLESENVFDIVFPYALGSKQSKKGLHLTHERGCSSFLEPDIEVVRRFFQHPEWFDVEDKIEVPICRFDEINNDEVNMPSPDLLQVDVQGYELEVLRGFGKLLSKVKLLQMEVVFYPLYKGQPLFTRMHEYMSEHGFVLHSLTPQGDFGENLVEANAIYYNEKYFRGNHQVRNIDLFCLTNCKNIFH